MSSAVPAVDTGPTAAIKQVRDGLGISTSDVAHALNVEVRTVDRWEKGLAYPQQEGRQRLAALLDLAQAATAFFATPADAHGWLRDPNRYLGGLTPFEAIRAGRMDRARAALGVMQWGIGI